MPDVVTTIATPILTILISTPLALSLIAPLGVNIGNLISNGLLLFSEKTGFIGLGVLAALWEFLVMTGMHLALMMPMLASFSRQDRCLEQHYAEHLRHGQYLALLWEQHSV